MSDKRAHIYYEGMVQGVGFRFSAQERATSLGLKGWVKNLDDGRVEVLCEGAERDIKAFLEKMALAFGTYISNTDIEWAEAVEEYKGFDISFD
ncbi:MAG: acylphosphatase [Candidatus Omnitrophica bacterium]|nr:acylphosphatase [Candidatus Omnitrophota bacterium]